MAENKNKVEQAKKIASKSSDTKNIYETVEESFLRLFRWASSLIDRLFFSKKYAGIFALVLAGLAYFTVTYDPSNTTTLSSSKAYSTAQ